ncbi:MAG TPA: hypothetical protein VN682_19635, partial [Terriglobales bacterium]|nr:hypothetical protein [Terriglobales bacterium]
DGSPLGHMVTVQRVCEGEETPVREGVASGKTGEYYIRLDVDAFSQLYAGFNMVPVACMLEAYDQNFVSGQIDLSDRSIVNNPRLPDIVLHCCPGHEF